MRRLGLLLVFVAACKGPAQEARTEPPPVPSSATVVTAPDAIVPLPLDTVQICDGPLGAVLTVTANGRPSSAA